MTLKVKLAICSSVLDTFATDPISSKCIQVQLTIALDLFSRSIVNWRFTPVGTEGVDTALLLYDIIRPKLMQNGSPERARLPDIGMPESIVVELANEILDNAITSVPVLHTELVVIDHSKVFISRAFQDACVRLGINFQLAHPYSPAYKMQVERMFRTIQNNFVERLPRHKGKDVSSSGLNIERRTFYSIDQIETQFTSWVATTLLASAS